MKDTVTSHPGEPSVVQSIHPSGGGFAAARRLLTYAAHLMPRRFALLTGLAAVDSVLQGTSFILLLPVLGSLGIGGSSSERLTGWLRATYASVGIPYSLGTILGFVFAIGLVSAAVGLCLTWLGHGMYRELVTAVQLDAYDAMVHARLSFLSGRRRGDAATVLTRLTEQAGNGFLLTLRILTDCMMAAALIAVALLQAWTFVFAVLGILALTAWPMWKNARVVHGLARRCHETIRSVGSHLTEHLRLLPTIKGLGAEAQSLRMIGKYVRASEHSLTRLKRRIEMVQSLWEVLVIGMVCGATYLGAAIFQLPVNRLLLLIGVCMRLVPALKNLVTRSEQLPLLLTAYDEVSAFTRECRFQAEPRGATTLKMEKLESPIELRHVSVRVGDTPLLRDVTITIPPRSLVALVGSSGSGKTSIASTILGLLETQSGEVRIGGVDLQTIDRRSWRQRVGYVSQDLPILTGTIRENLLLAAPNADEAAMAAAIEAAQAGEFLRSLPNGLDSFVGEHGSRLSGGERQRLVLARALIRKPVLLVLDEATNALDAATAKEILATVEGIRRDCAVLMIAHDLDGVRTADAIYVIENGQVTEHGSWDQLIARQGRFSQLAAVQGVA